MRHRIDGLDYLRGIFACTVMAYHFYVWGGLEAPQVVHDTLWKLGKYAVSAFYVISGLSLGYVYRSGLDLRAFWIKRLFRLAPLYWLTVGLTLLVADRMPGLLTILLNLTLTFGFIVPDWSIVAGGWSIGDEVTFYAAFPLLAYALARSRVLFAALLALSLALAWNFAFRILEPSVPMTDPAQWRAYVNPFNQVFLFAAGVGLSAYIGPVRLSPRVALLSALAIALAFVLPPLGTDTLIVTGWWRFYYSALCVGLCAVAAFAPLPSVRPLRFLGETSYSIYLLHPLALTFSGSIWLAVPLTFLAAHLVYQRIELPFIRMGRRYASSTSRKY